MESNMVEEVRAGFDVLQFSWTDATPALTAVITPDVIQYQSTARMSTWSEEEPEPEEKEEEEEERTNVRSSVMFLTSKGLWSMLRP
jgi:hypothetical protein